MDIPGHWEQIYAGGSPQETSWYATHLQTSFTWIAEAVESKMQAILDVGGGASTLVDDLSQAGYSDLTILDISESALHQSRKRLGAAADSVQWLRGDVTTVSLPASSYGLWHDRAVFHFLTQPRQRAAYVEQLRSSLKQGGHVVMATFGLDGPRTCSGLEVIRYDAQSLHRELGSDFRLVRSTIEAHHTPAGSTQPFLYCQFAFRPAQQGATS